MSGEILCSLQVIRGYGRCHLLADSPHLRVTLPDLLPHVDNKVSA